MNRWKSYLVLTFFVLSLIPSASAQAAVAYSISFTNGQVQLDVRPGASGIGWTEMVVSNEGQATIDVDVSLSGGGVTISPGAVSVTSITTKFGNDKPIGLPL